MNNNAIQASGSSLPSSKRKRESNTPIASDDSVDNLRAEALAAQADKIKLAKLANRQINEVKILSDNVTDILKICYSGLEDYRDVAVEPTIDMSENLPSKFINAAHKLRAETTRSQILANSINHILASCNKSSEALRAFRIQEIKNRFSEENKKVKLSNKAHQQSTPISKKVKKRIRFSTSTKSSEKFSASNVETDHDKIEISIPVNNDKNEFTGDTVSITIQSNRIKEDLAKFRSNMVNEDVDFSTFQISQESAQFDSNEQSSPVKFDESIDFNSTDAEIMMENEANTDTSDDQASIIRFEEFSYFKPTQAWMDLSEAERQQIDLTSSDRVRFFEKTVRKQVEKKQKVEFLNAPDKSEK